MDKTRFTVDSGATKDPAKRNRMVGAAAGPAPEVKGTRFCRLEPAQAGSGRKSNPKPKKRR